MLKEEKDKLMNGTKMAAKYGVSEKQIFRLGVGRLLAMTEDARLVLTNAVKADETKFNRVGNLKGTAKPRSLKSIKLPAAV